jgi:hypothetical protein
MLALWHAFLSGVSGQSIAEEFNFVTEQAITKTITLSKVQEATKNDKELQSVGRALQSGNWKDKSISDISKWCTVERTPTDYTYITSK